MISNQDQPVQPRSDRICLNCTDCRPSVG